MYVERWIPRCLLPGHQVLVHTSCRTYTLPRVGTYLGMYAVLDNNSTQYPTYARRGFLILPSKVVLIIARQARLSESGKGKGKDPSRMHLLAGQVYYDGVFPCSFFFYRRTTSLCFWAGLMTSFLIDTTWWGFSPGCSRGEGPRQTDGCQLICFCQKCLF